MVLQLYVVIIIKIFLENGRLGLLQKSQEAWYTGHVNEHTPKKNGVVYISLMQKIPYAESLTWSAVTRIRSVMAIRCENGDVTSMTPITNHMTHF